MSLQKSTPLRTRRLILEVRWGPLAHHKAVIEPGQLLRVGRAESAGLALPHDKAMSEAHFELSWDGSRGWVRDLVSYSGTHLEGQRVEQGEVFHGSWVRAGYTDFSVYFERTTPSREPVTLHPSVQEHSKAHALEMLRAQTSPLYAILDAARSERILELLHESVEEYCSLYEGPKGESLEEVAPYLVRLPKESWLLKSLVYEGWGSSWGIYLTSSQPLLALRRHFRRFLMVEQEGAAADMLYFRFYDPRVMLMFLPTCTGDQQRVLLEVVEVYLYEGENSELHVFYPNA